MEIHGGCAVGNGIVDNIMLGGYVSAISFSFFLVLIV